MSDFTAFEVLTASDSEQKIAKQAATDKLAAAIYDVREQYGEHLFCAKSKDEFNDRVALCKDDMMKTVNAHLMPVTGVMRKVCKAMEREWRERVAADDNRTADDDEENQEWGKVWKRGPGGKDLEERLNRQEKESRRRTANRPLHEIAKDIKANWPKVNYAAQPYLDAMHELESVDDMYYQDPASYIVNYFLSNAGTWRGPEAKRIKDELKGMVRGASRHTADTTGPVQDLDQTFSPSDDNLIPEGDFHAWKDSVDQDGPEKVDRNFTPGGDSGKEARRRVAGEWSDEDEETAWKHFMEDSPGSEDEEAEANKFMSDFMKGKGKKSHRQANEVMGYPEPGGQPMDPAMANPAMMAPSPPGTASSGAPGTGSGAVTASVIKRYAQWCVDNLARPSFKTMEYYAANRPDREYFILTAALQRHAEVPGGAAPDVNWGVITNPYGSGSDPQPVEIEPAMDGMMGQPGGALDLGKALSGYTGSRRTAAGKDYLLQADEAITNLLNEKAEEFQESIQPLQQALQTIQYAEQMQQAQNPMNVMPPAGTVNVLPQNQAPQGPAPQGVDPASGQVDPAMLQQLMAMGGMDPAMLAQMMGGGGAPAPSGGVPPAAAAQGAIPPELAAQMQMQARRRRTASCTIESLAREYGVQPHELAALVGMDRHDSLAPLSEEDEAFIRDVVENTDAGGVYHEGAVSELGYDWPPKDDEEDEYHPDPRTREEYEGRGKSKKAEAPQRGRTAKDSDCTCWEGYERVPGTKPCASKSCRKKTSQRHEAGVFEEWQRWVQSRAQQGQLGVGGDKDLYDFAADYGIGERGIEKLRRYLFGSRKHAWTGWGPTTAARQHQVDGWEWDKRLSAYVTTSQPDDFTCRCGAKLSVPGYHNCKCGKIWNSYVIGTGGENRQAAVEKYLCREVPVRDNVIVAGKRRAASEEPSGEKAAGGVLVSLTNNAMRGTSGHRWNIHKPGCSALNRGKRERDLAGYDELNEYPDRRSVVLDIYPPDQFDYDPDHPKWGWKSYGKDIRVHDCLKGQLPEDARTAARKTSSGARYVLLPHWDPQEAHRILLQHHQEMNGKTALQVTPELMEHARNGGFTLHDHIGDAPTDGYMVSLDKHSEESMPIEDLTPEMIEQFVGKHSENLSKKGNYLGGWLDNGRFYLDVSSHIPELSRATGAAVRNKQLGIYDLAKGRTINTEEAGYMTGHPGVVGRRNHGATHPAQKRSAGGSQRPSQGRRVTTAGKDNCPACGKGIRSYDLSGTEDHHGQKWCKECLPDGIKAQMKERQGNLLDAVSTRIGSDEDDDFASAAWPSDHHPDTGNKLKSTPDDWHRRDKNQRWTGKG